MGPETTEVNVGLGHALVAEKKPHAEDGLGKDVEDSVGNDLSVDGGLAGSIGDTPDTIHMSVTIQKSLIDE